MNRNSLWKTGAQVPAVHSNNETVTFRHREYLGDILGSTAFTTQSFSVNPGLEATFPYLSAIASNFQEFKFRGLIFEFKSTSATALNSTNTALGTVALIAQYRADAIAPTNKVQLLNEMWAVDCKPSEDLILPVECAPKENPLSVQYVRSGNVPSGQDPKFYDLAKVTIATVGMQAAATIGELWVSYDVELYKPVLSIGGGLDILANNFHAWSNTSVANATPFGTSRTVFFDTIGITISGSTITIPPGNPGTYNLQYYAEQSSGSLSFSGITPVNTTQFKTFTNQTNDARGTAATTTTSGTMLFTFIIIAPQTSVATIQFTATFGGTPSYMDLMLFQLNSGFA
jgi:hypothetical protein